MNFLAKLIRSKKSEDLTTQQIRILKDNEEKINEFEQTGREIYGDPELEINPLDLFAPDLAVAGIHSKMFKTKGRETIIPLSALTNKHKSLFLRRKFFRMAYIRTVWIPNATELPGEVMMGILDHRAKPGYQVVNSASNEAKRMHLYTYQQDVYIDVSEFEMFSLFVNLSGFSHKYGDNINLGSVRVYWVLQWTNDPTQHVMTKLESELIPKTNMPTVRNLKHLPLNKAINVARRSVDLGESSDHVSNNQKLIFRSQSLKFEENVMNEDEEILIEDPDAYEELKRKYLNKGKGIEKIEKTIKTNKFQSDIDEVNKILERDNG